MGCTSSKEQAAGIDESLKTSATSKKKSYMKRRSTSLTEGVVGVEIDGYEMLGFLGKGAYAHVERAREVATNEEVAIKVFERGVLRKQKSMTRVGRQVTVTTALDKLDAEISLMRSLDHSHIIRLYDVVEDPVTDRLFLVLELAALGPVATFDEDLGLFSCAVEKGAVAPDRAARYVAEMASALSHMHARHVVHRDLKPDNMLLTARHECKLADFGVSYVFTGSLGGSESGADSRAFDKNLHGADLAKRLRQISKAQSMAQIGATEGTYYYWAPEMMQAPEEGRAHFNAFACDVWALGVCYYNFRTRENPFTSEAVDDLFDAISEGAVDLERDELSADERRLLRGLLAVDPAERVTVGDLLEDPYLVRYPVHHSTTAFSAKSTPRAHLSRRGSQRGTFAGRSSGSAAAAGYHRAGSRGDGDVMEASGRPSPPASGPSPPVSSRASPEPLRDIWSSDDGEPGAAWRSITEMGRPAVVPRDRSAPPWTRRVLGRSSTRVEEASSKHPASRRSGLVISA